MATFALPSEVDRSTLDELHTHMVTFKTGYRNMHLRSFAEEKDATGKKRRRLQYVCILYAHPDGSVEGQLSGPQIHADFRLIPRGIRAVGRVHWRLGSKETREEVSKDLWTSLLQRARQERNQKPFRGRPKRTPGEFYVQRRKLGMASDHPTCEKALSQNILDRAFVEQLEKWQFELLLG